MRLLELWCVLRKRMKGLFARRRLEQDLDDEMSFHLAMRAENQVAEGMTPREANLAARKQFGNATQIRETCRDAWTFAWLERVYSDLRQAVRLMVKKPGFLAAAVLCLALGIGASAAIFSVIDQIVLRKPFPQYERLAIFGFNNPSSGFLSLTYSVQIMPCVEHGKSFEAFALNAWGRGTMNTGSATFGAEYGNVNKDFFSVLGAKPILGRLFHPNEFKLATGDVLVLRYEFWKEYFGGDPDIIGHSVVMDGRSYKIVGVLSRDFPFTDSLWQSVFRPLTATSDPANPVGPPFSAFTRLRPGVTLDQANAETSMLWAATDAPPFFKELAKENPIYLKYVSELDSEGGFPKILTAFLCAVGFLYAIACMNVANLMLVRLSARKHELGIRSALGGSGAAIGRLILMEGLVLNFVAGLFGFILAMIMKPLIMNLVFGTGESLKNGIRLDERMLLFTVGISLITVLILTAVSAWKLSREDLQNALKDSGMAISESPKLQRLRESFVVVCAAMAMVLLIGTGLMTRSVQRLMRVDLGFDPSQKIALWLDLPRSMQAVESRHNLARRIEERLKNIPEIRNACTTSVVPFAGTSTSRLRRSDGSELHAGGNPVSSDYFRSMDMRLLKGRWLPPRPEGQPEVMLINESLATKFFGKEDPIGRSIISGDGEVWEVIGVVANVRDQIRSNDPQPQYYYPYWQEKGRSDVISLMLDLSIKPTPVLVQSIRKAIYEVEPKVGVRTPVELLEAARKQIDKERFTLFVLGLISGIATLLAVFGLFSVMAYSVALRMKEFGIRLALGASTKRIFLSVLRRGFILAVIGIVIGLVGSWALTRFIKSLLFEISPLDPAVHVSISFLLFVAAVFACLIPSIRASRADPSSLLKSE